MGKAKGKSKTDRINRGENTPESLDEMAKSLRALSTAVERAGLRLAGKNQPVVKVFGTVGAWKSLKQLQRFAAQLKLELGHLPPRPPE